MSPLLDQECGIPRRQTEVAVKEEEDNKYDGGANVCRFEELVEAVPTVVC